MPDTLKLPEKLKTFYINAFPVQNGQTVRLGNNVEIIDNTKSDLTRKAGVDNILIDKDAFVKIFTLTGVLIYEGEYSQSNLTRGTYIVLSQDKAVKKVIK